MIYTLLVTILVEGAVGIVYSVWHRKPIGSILITSVCANLITQSLLWGMLILFFQHYVVTLLVAECLIWVIESLALHYVPTNRLKFGEAIMLSLIMNLVSFTLGLFLPI